MKCAGCAGRAGLTAIHSGGFLISLPYESGAGSEPRPASSGFPLAVLAGTRKSEWLEKTTATSWVSLEVRTSGLGEQPVVFAMRPDPEPHNEPLLRDADGPPVKVDPHGVDRESRVHLLETGSMRPVPDGRRRRLEEVAKLPGRARPHALQRLRPTRGVLGECLFGESREKILGLREGRGPTLF